MFKMTDGHLNGYIKPFIKDLKVLNVKKDIKKKGGVLRMVKEAVVGLFAKAVKIPKTKKIATIIGNPLRSGRIRSMTHPCLGFSVYQKY
jgi:hypothetical protein